MNRSDRHAWASARSLADLGELTAQWLEGRIAAVPGYSGPPDEETREIVTVLAACNRAAFVTNCSQPGGSGVYYRPWQQRAAVEGFADAETAVRLWEATEGIGLLRTYQLAPRFFASRKLIIPVSRGGASVMDTCFGTALSRRHLSDDWTGFGTCHPDAVDAVCSAYQVTLIDAEWGRHDSPLWVALAAFAGIEVPA